MDQTRSFTTAAKEAEDIDGEEIYEFDVDGFAMTAFKPSDSQLALLMADTGRYSTRQQMVAGAIDFFHAVLDDVAAAHIRARLLDRRDPFGLPEVQNIMEWLIGEWTGQDFDSPSGSTGSRSASGRKSKPRTPALTS